MPVGSRKSAIPGGGDAGGSSAVKAGAAGSGAAVNVQRKTATSAPGTATAASRFFFTTRSYPLSSPARRILRYHRKGDGAAYRLRARGAVDRQQGAVWARRR